MRTFAECLRETLGGRFGKAKLDEIEARYAAKVERFTEENDPAPMSRAWQEVFSEIEHDAAVKARKAVASVERYRSVVETLDIPQKRKIKVSTWLGDGWLVPSSNAAAERDGIRLSLALKGQIEGDARVGGVAQQVLHSNETAAMFRALGSGVTEFAKDALGRQRRLNSMSDLGRALFGENTTDAAAEAIGKAWRAVNSANVARLQSYGVEITELDGRGLGQRHSRVLMSRNKEQWIDDHLAEGVVDWSRTLHPDGSLVRQADRRAFIEAVWKTKTTGGVNKLNPTDQFGSAGPQIGAHRVMHYAGFDAWESMHTRYGEGTVFDVLVEEIDQMAHALSMAQKFGPNYEAWLNTAKVLGAQRAFDQAPNPEHGAAAQAAFTLHVENTVEPMMRIAGRRNIDTRESALAIGTSTAANVITSAWLGSVTLTAVPADLFQSGIIRYMSGLRAFSPLSRTVGLLAQDSTRTFEQMLAYGHVADQHILGMRTQTRFVGSMSEGLSGSQWLAGAVMRANGNTRWTTNARATNAREWGINAFGLGRSTEFGDLPWRQIAERYGITAQDWNDFRALTPVEVARGVYEMPPALALDAGRRDLYNKFAGLVEQEGKFAIIDTSVESRLMLRGDTQADTFVGALLRSFSMFKMFPVTFLNILTRTAYSQQGGNRAGRLAFLVGAMSSLTVAGAFAVQMKELSKGRDLRDMDPRNDPSFWGQSFLTGGAGGFVADLFLNGTTEYGRGMEDAIAGPLFSVLNDAVRVSLADPFKFVTGAEQHKTLYTSKAGVDAFNAVMNVVPGQNLWWARPITESVRLSVGRMIDEKTVNERLTRAERRRLETTGQGRWWESGDFSPSRAPAFADLGE